MAPAEVRANARAFQEKVSQIVPSGSADTATDAPSEVRFTVNEVQAALVEGAAEGSVSTAQPGASSSSAPNLPSAQLSNGQQLTVTSAPVVNFEGDVVKGQFQAELAGQPVTVTVAGHLGSSDGYVTFNPTEFKIGSVPVPVSLVNDQLQKKMMGERDKMKLPPDIAGIRIEDGQLVVTRK